MNGFLFKTATTVFVTLPICLTPSLLFASNTMNHSSRSFTSEAGCMACHMGTTTHSKKVVRTHHGNSRSDVQA